MKKWIAMLLALVMLLSLAACDKDDGDNTTATPTGGNATAAPTGGNTQPPVADGENQIPDDGNNQTPDDGNVQPPDDGLVNAVCLTQMIKTEESIAGEFDTMRWALEYDEDHNLIACKVYLNDKLYVETTYNKDMNMPLVTKDYDLDGNPSGHCAYTYDENGRCLGYDSTYSYDGETMTNKAEYTYDERGNKLTEKIYLNGNLDGDYRYTYTSDDRLETEWCIFGSEETRTQYTYDEHGNLLRIVHTGSDSGYTDTYENTYENGKLVELKVYEDGALYNQIRYDADGNEILWVGYDTEDGSEWVRIESLRENGNLVREDVSYGGEKDHSDSYTYDADGKLIRHEHTTPNGDDYYFDYTYTQEGDISGVKHYEQGLLVGETTLTYEAVKVTPEVAAKLQTIIDTLDIE